MCTLGDTYSFWTCTYFIATDSPLSLRLPLLLSMPAGDDPGRLDGIDVHGVGCLQLVDVAIFYCSEHGRTHVCHSAFHRSGSTQVFCGQTGTGVSSFLYLLWFCAPLVYLFFFPLCAEHGRASICQSAMHCIAFTRTFSGKAHTRAHTIHFKSAETYLSVCARRACCLFHNESQHFMVLPFSPCLYTHLPTCMQTHSRTRTRTREKSADCNSAPDPRLVNVTHS